MFKLIDKDGGVAQEFNDGDVLLRIEPDGIDLILLTKLPPEGSPEADKPMPKHLLMAAAVFMFLDDPENVTTVIKSFADKAKEITK